MRKKLDMIEKLIFEISSNESALKKRILEDMKGIYYRYYSNKKNKKIKSLKKYYKKENKMIKAELKKISKDLTRFLKTKDSSLQNFKHNLNLLLDVQRDFVL